MPTVIVLPTVTDGNSWERGFFKKKRGGKTLCNAPCLSTSSGSCAVASCNPKSVEAVAPRARAAAEAHAKAAAAASPLIRLSLSLRSHVFREVGDQRVPVLWVERLVVPVERV